MIYAYLRVSTDQQTIENQRFEINNYCERYNMQVEKWVTDEGVSGTKYYTKRNLIKIIKKAKKGDLILCSEISRLGRDLLMIMEILNILMKHEVKLHTIKDNFNLGDDIQCKVLAFAFGLAAEIERKLISQRTKEALARKKAEGVILGRPVGRRNSQVKLTGKEELIKQLLLSGTPQLTIAKKCKVDNATLDKFIRYNDMRQYIQPNVNHICKLDKRKKEVIETINECGGVLEYATKKLNVGKPTLQRFIERNNLNEIVDKARNKQKELSKQAYIEAITESGGVIKHAAEKLGIEAKTLRIFIVENNLKELIIEIRKKTANDAIESFKQELTDNNGNIVRTAKQLNTTASNVNGFICKHHLRGFVQELRSKKEKNPETDC